MIPVVIYLRAHAKKDKIRSQHEHIVLHSEQWRKSTIEDQDYGFTCIIPLLLLRHCTPFESTPEQVSELRNQSGIVQNATHNYRAYTRLVPTSQPLIGSCRRWAGYKFGHTTGTTCSTLTCCCNLLNNNVLPGSTSPRVCIKSPEYGFYIQTANRTD